MRLSMPAAPGPVAQVSPPEIPPQKNSDGNRSLLAVSGRAGREPLCPPAVSVLVVTCPQRRSGATPDTFSASRRQWLYLGHHCLSPFTVPASYRPSAIGYWPSPPAPRPSAVVGLVVWWFRGACCVLHIRPSPFGFPPSPFLPIPPLPPMPASPAQPLGYRLLALRPSAFRLPYTARFTRPAISTAAASAAGLSAVASTAAVTVPSTPAARW